jgi:2-keto-4-pentenoate hydratase/2-oxohepta-3-ene-1,7-dioic acid hydratase in catechol pathway
MASFRLMSYGATPRQGRAGILIADEIYDAEKLTGVAEHRTVLGILEDWPAAEGKIGAAAGNPDKAARVGAVGSQHILAPILYPGAIFCVAANYADHAQAMARRANRPVEPDPRTLGIKPFHFMKPPKQSVIGPYDDLVMPAFGKNLDWELELAVVIGRPAKNVSAEQALDHVAGYTVSNDVSVRDAVYMKRPNIPENSPFNSDFIGLKGFDNSCILGPAITPAAQIGDPTRLGMKLWVGDEIKQDSNSSNMIFSVAEQIAYLSERHTLLPGDVILTGTPAGTGAESGRFLKKGETIRMWIENIGETRNTTR